MAAENMAEESGNHNLQRQRNHKASEARDIVAAKRHNQRRISWRSGVMKRMAWQWRHHRQCNGNHVSNVNRK